MSQYDGRAAALVPGRLHGYREWKLTSPFEGVVLLQSLTQGTTWAPTPIHRGRCARAKALADGWGRPHEVPDPQCACGIYACHDPALLFDSSKPPVFGVVEAWGRVEVGPRGFRAEQVRIAGLFVREFAPRDPVFPKSWVVPVPVRQGVYSMNDFKAALYGQRPADLVLNAEQLEWLDAERARLAEQAAKAREEAMTLLAEQYRVPVYPSMEALLSDFPKVDVRELLGDPPEPEGKADESFIAKAARLFGLPGGVAPWQVLPPAPSLDITANRPLRMPDVLPVQGFRPGDEVSVRIGDRTVKGTITTVGLSRGRQGGKGVEASKIIFDELSVGPLSISQVATGQELVRYSSTEEPARKPRKPRRPRKPVDGAEQG